MSSDRAAILAACDAIEARARASSGASMPLPATETTGSRWRSGREASGAAGGLTPTTSGPARPRGGARQAGGRWGDRTDLGDDACCVDHARRGRCRPGRCAGRAAGRSARCAAAAGRRCRPWARRARRQDAPRRTRASRRRARAGARRPSPRGGGAADALVPRPRRGADATAGMVATLGRASRLGDRSLGSADPGARSFAISSTRSSRGPRGRTGSLRTGPTA